MKDTEVWKISLQLWQESLIRVWEIIPRTDEVDREREIEQLKNIFSSARADLGGSAGSPVM